MIKHYLGTEFKALFYLIKYLGNISSFPREEKMNNTQKSY